MLRVSLGVNWMFHVRRYWKTLFNHKLPRSNICSVRRVYKKVNQYIRVSTTGRGAGPLGSPVSTVDIQWWEYHHLFHFSSDFVFQDRHQPNSIFEYSCKKSCNFDTCLMTRHGYLLIWPLTSSQ
jgi:hypothetical protein